MPAPDATLLAALRSADRPARHLFFKMTHSQGTVLAWDGLGTRVFNGETYQGDRIISVQGLSKSRDLQTQEVLVALKGNALPALASIDPNIRNETATITAVWYSETGSQIAYKTLFAGLGNYITMDLAAGQFAITAHLRGRMADWSRAPQAYYTAQEQRRLYPGDTGFDYMKTLENTTVTGWGRYSESAGGSAKYHASTVPYDSLQVRGLGNDLGGFGFNATSDSTLFPRGYATNQYVGETTAVGIARVSASGMLQLSSNDMYIDIYGDVRSNDGQRIIASGLSTSNRFRIATAIESIGVSTGVKLVKDATLNTIILNGYSLVSSGSNPTQWRDGSIWINSGGSVFASGASVLSQYYGSITGGSTSTSVALIEETTGNAVSMSGSDVICNGSNVYISDTGVVLTAAGRRIYPTGGDVNRDFARIWIV